jgi:hypothetical protein
LTAAALGLAVLGLALGAFLLKRTPADPGIPSEEPFDPEPGVTYNLLTRPPKRLLAVNLPDDRARWRLDESQQAFEVHCEDLNLFRLGNAPRPGYSIELSIRQIRWHGFTGIFFGYHEDVYRGTPCFKYQWIELRQERLAGPDPTWTLSRKQGFILRKPGRNPQLVSQEVVRAAVPQPRFPEYPLQITVEKRGLTEVRWGDLPLPQLTTPQANSDYTDRDYQGAYGVYCDSTDTTFRKAFFTLSERNDP